MNYVDNLETLKSIKRKARATYGCLRAIYSNKLSTSLRAERKIFAEAIAALDAMYRIYEARKYGMRKKPIDEQIKFASMWDTFITCIDTMTAYKTKDKYLLSYPTRIKEPVATQTALKIWNSFNP